MRLVLKRNIIHGFFIILLGAMSAPAQIVLGSPSVLQPQVVVANPSAFQGIETQNVRTTRQALNGILQAYPPTLREILQRDASLLSNETFMDSYPLLREFTNSHPEVARDPQYFFGQPQNFPIVQAAGRGRNIMEPVLVVGSIIGATGFFVWIIRAVVDHRRWLRLTKLQTEANARLMERFTSNDDLLTFIQTPAGRRFMESSTVPSESRSIGAPVSRILWSLQVGVVTWIAGIGMEFVSTRVSVGEDTSDLFYVLGVLGMAVGLGFVLSGIVTYGLSRRFGLFDRFELKERGEVDSPPA